jgi:hypothetical protein
MTQGNPIFDQLFERSAPLVLDGKHQREEPPVDGGRWPVSVVATGAFASYRAGLARLLTELIPYAGSGHFMTGRPDTSHITVRALEPYREAAARDELIVGDWVDAMKRTAAEARPFMLSCTGLTLTEGGVLAQLEPHDAVAWHLLDQFRSELGELAWFEDQWMKRNIWYSSVIHFAGDIRDPRGLVDWVAAHRHFDEPWTVEISGLELVRFHHTVTDSGTAYMRPSVWHVVEFGSRREGFDARG